MGLEEYKSQMERCSRCSLCKWVPIMQVKNWRFAQNCPSILKYNFHSYSAGGKIIAALGLLENRFELTDEFVDIVYRCSMDGACGVSCKNIMSTGIIDSMEILHELRVKLFKDGRIPKRHKDLINDVEKYDNPYKEPKEKRSQWAEGLDIKEVTKEKAEVLYYVGCTAAYRTPSNAKNTARILELAGVDFGTLGENEICCASTPYKIGATGLFEKYARKNIKTFNDLDVKTIVTQCAGCYHMLKVEYPKIGKINAEVLHISEYITRLMEKGKIKFTKEVPLKVTWHDPCHLGRLGEPSIPWEGKMVKAFGQALLFDPPKKVKYGLGGVYEPPRNILRNIPGLDFVEMMRIREYSFCCAAGGGVRAAYPELARFAGAERIEEAKTTGAEALVTCCPFCELNFGETIEEKKEKIKLYDLTELVLQAMGEKSYKLEIER